MSEPPATPSYGELAALVAEQAAQLAEQAVLIGALRVELEALRRQVGRDSSNSSQPPSKDGPAAKAKAGGRPAGQEESQESRGGQPSAGAAGRVRRKQGGQQGHRGSGLAPVATPDKYEWVEPSCCAGCGGGLAGAPGTVGSRVQVFDLPSFSLAVTEYQMMRRVCGCGQATTAAAPTGVRGGPTCYGPNVTAAATLLASQDVLGIERTADLMSALLGAAVSTGFISSAPWGRLRCGSACRRLPWSDRERASCVCTLVSPAHGNRCPSYPQIIVTRNDGTSPGGMTPNRLRVTAPRRAASAWLPGHPHSYCGGDQAAVSLSSWLRVPPSGV